MSGRVALPMPGCQYWTAGRKNAVILALETGMLTEAEACQRYGTSFDELGEWRRGKLFATAPARSLGRTPRDIVDLAADAEGWR